MQFVFKPALVKNESLKGKSVAQIAREQNKDVLDAFLDLAVEYEQRPDASVVYFALGEARVEIMNPERV